MIFFFFFCGFICHQTSPFSKFTIDGHSGILRIKPGETLDYESTPTHFVTVVAKVGSHFCLTFHTLHPHLSENRKKKKKH